ncbi:MAG: hypothetical protein V2J24_13670 [Pseudomonadales bacterium]|jgi:hypothetical protein|nr:hypothetical protein [Pseudomonadales bacterium]
MAKGSHGGSRKRRADFPFPERELAPWEFWPARLFEAPYYATLMTGCLLHGLPLKALARANWALDHGEIGIGSKYATQLAFDQRWFPATAHLPADLNAAEKSALIRDFALAHGLPVVLKPDMGAVGKGLLRVDAQDRIDEAVARLASDYLLQAYVDAPAEFGVFWQRHGREGRITGINEKHFPTVVGNGRDDLATLAAGHVRYTHHWDLFLGDHALARVPEAGEVVRLSFVGSHTMGCRFTDDTHLLSGALLDAVSRFLEDQPGYNFGRLDLRCAGTEALRDGDFTVIEANGIASLPTHMFDPRHTLGRAWAIFRQHGRDLVRIAAEHRHVPMDLAGWGEIAARVRSSRKALDGVHARALEAGRARRQASRGRGSSAETRASAVT